MYLALLLALPISLSAADPPPDLGPWKKAGTLKLPSPAVGMTITADNRLVLALCSEKRRRDSGGTVPGFVELFVLRCFSLDTGKETMTGGVSQLAPRMALRNHRVAVSDTFDKVAVFDLDEGKKICQIDPRSPNDSPAMNIKGVPPGLRDFGGGGRLSDLEFTGDGKVLLTIRKENTPWKQNGKGAFTSESFDRVVFWDADKGTKLATLDCEDRQLYDGHLTLLPVRQQMLAKFSNGLRILDLSTKKWSKSFSMKDVWSASVSADDKLIVVTGRDQTVRILDSDSLKTLRTFKEQPLNTLPRLDGSLNPMGFEFGPSATFVDGDRVLRVVLNDQATVIYRDAKSGAKIPMPAAEALTFPDGSRPVGISADRRCALTMTVPGSDNCTIWRRDVVESRK